MHEDGKKLLNLMFRPGETVSVSPNLYGYHSLSLETILSNDTVTLVPTQDSVHKRNLGRRTKGLPDLTWEECFEQCPTKDLKLVALNPLKGFREDTNVTAYRSFLVEVDWGPIDEQIAYLKRIGVPYSALMFSGGKSIHCLITVDRDIPKYEDYYFMAEWILRIATMADPNTKNPSRSIRIPGAEREPGKFQQLVEFKGVTKIEDLANWLRLHPEAKPKPPEKKIVAEKPIDLLAIKPWVARLLVNGLDPTKSRNKQWFSIAYEFALSGFDEDDTIAMLSTYFNPDRDFKEKEWLTTVRSAFKTVYKK